jgi:hypothetical protein
MLMHASPSSARVCVCLNSKRDPLWPAGSKPASSQEILGDQVQQLLLEWIDTSALRMMWRRRQRNLFVAASEKVQNTPVLLYF